MREPEPSFTKYGVFQNTANLKGVKIVAATFMNNKQTMQHIYN